ncbi:Neural proliferation differentiation and control protein 1 [Collichthys lucidus]|uniref:Neural proliferation differentiation and control protein 1 n=1 Tax=Collichthys lucidus TaxID=240159 RepID=A0A4U5V9Z8_COLLU|nr:Neural proliferation differentiation and control protein 1 [Collichthys lucidus]
MLLLSCPRNGRLCRASPLLLAAVLLCVVPVSGSLPDKVTFDPNLDEEIDYLHSIIEKQQLVSKTEKQHHVSAAVTSQTDVKKSKTDASNHKQKSQSHLSDQTPHATTTTAPRVAASALPNTPHPKATGHERRVGPIAIAQTRTDTIIVIMISVCVAVGTVAVILATVCYVKLQKDQRLAQKVDYPAFGGASVSGAATNGNGPSMGDKTLAQSAQMYHYQHQKQQMLSELMVDHRNSGSEIHGVPRGQIVQWHPLSLPAVCLPAAICGQRLALGERICTVLGPSKAFEWPLIKGEWEKFT